MADENKTVETPMPALDERAIAKKYGLRELRYPDSEHVRAMLSFLDATIEAGKCGPVPKTAVVVLLEYLQATINRQHITKGPRMSHDEFDILQTPYYLAARIMAKVQRARQENTKGQVYQSTYVSLTHFVELLRNVLDPGCYWLRLRVPEGVVEVMQALREYLAVYSDQRRKARPV